MVTLRGENRSQTAGCACELMLKCEYFFKIWLSLSFMFIIVNARLLLHF